MEVQNVSDYGSPELTALTNKLIELSVEYTDLMNSMMRSAKSAFLKRWESGKLLDEHHALIIEECGTVREFCRLTGYSEFAFSKNLNGYRAIRDNGLTTPDQITAYLTENKIEPSSRNFENMKSLLLTGGKPMKDKTPKERRTVTANAEKRLEEIQYELEGLRDNFIQPSNAKADLEVTEEIKEEVASLLEYVDDMRGQKMKLRPARIPFRSKVYTEFVKNYHYDVITLVPLTEQADPHHANEYDTAGVGQKINDLCQIPVSRETHIDLEEGREKPTREEILEAQRDVLVNYVMFLHKSLGIK